MRRLKVVLFGLLVLVLALFAAGYLALRSPAVRGKIERSLSEALGRPVLGTADLSTDVRGSGATAPAIQRSLAGSARFKVVNGTIRMPIIAAINQALGITEGSGKDTKFQSFSATAAIGGGRARTDDLQLRAGDLTVVGSGTMGFDQTLDFRLKAILSPAKSRELTSKAGFLGDLRNALGQLELPLTITGTATNPKTRVDIGSIAKKQMKGIEKGLQKLFR
jgi:AsmA protein